MFMRLFFIDKEDFIEMFWLFISIGIENSVKKTKYLFTGDTLFCGSVGRTDFPGGNWELLTSSLQKICSLPEETIIFPGHGNHCVLKEEKKHNPFIYGNSL